MIALAGPISLFAEGPFRFENTPGKLPKQVVPKSYDIHLKPAIAERTFTGSETVVVEVSKPTKTITLNANALTIPTAKLLGAAGKIEANAAISFDAPQQTVTLTFEHEVAAGTHQLAFDFAGKINEAGQGLFAATYQEEGSGAKKVMLGTQMEATDARRIFPCWDEPSFRARFRLSASLPNEFSAVSNMPIEREGKTSSGKEVRFGETPPMASYLVVFCAGELDAIHGEADGVKIGVVTTKGKAETGRYALESAEKILHYYDEYFGIKFPLPKLDLIAVPGGFGGAMENWGGIVFFESALLYDPKKSSEETKEGIFGVIAHEMAHQWFGDLVTMAWWDNLWLNEGFASWMGTKCSDHFNPQWQVWLRADGEKQYAMVTDSLSTTHPIQQPVKTESEADSAFDEITYQKGQSFLRMLESYLGESDFREGIRGYMQAHKFSNSTTADLWQALAASSKKPVAAIAASWTEQPGLPLVSTSPTDSGLTISQERFTLHQKNPATLFWKIPIAYAEALPNEKNPPVRNFLLEAHSAALPDVKPAQTVILNAGDVGYYRVRYDDAMFGRLLATAPQLPVTAKIDLLADTWALVRAEHAPVANLFRLIETLRNENELPVWDRITSPLLYLDALYIGSDERPAYRQYARALMQPIFQRVGWTSRPNEPVATGLLRVSVLNALGELRDPAVIAGAQERFQKFLADPSTLAPDLRATIFTIVGANADQKTWDRLHQLGLATKNIEEKQNYYFALAAAPNFAAQSLALSLGDELPGSRATAMVIVVSGVAEQPQAAWDFAKAHQKELAPKLDSMGLTRFLPGVARGFNDAAHATELETYVRATLPGTSMSEVDKAAEQIRTRADLKARLLPEIGKWLATKTPGA